MVLTGCSIIVAVSVEVGPKLGMEDEKIGLVTGTVGAENEDEEN